MDPYFRHNRSIIPESPGRALARVIDAPVALLGLGIPRCPATILLPASLSTIADVRPDLPIALAILTCPEDWAARETLLWPRGIRISRSIVPVLVILCDGWAVATRRGGAPAHVIDAWLTERIGPGAVALATGLSADEQRGLGQLARRRAQHAAVEGRAVAE
jgi:hypothetical protein